MINMKMNANLKRLLAIEALTGVINIYMGTFMNARLYELSNNSIQTIATYNIITYMFIAITFLIFGNKIKSEPLKVLRTGIILRFTLLIFIMLVNDAIIDYYVIFAIIFGISQGAYYSPYQGLIGIYNDNMVRYCTILNMLTNFVSIVFPITIGVCIDVASFKAVAAFMLVVSGVQILISFRIDKVLLDTKFSIKSFFKSLKKSKNNTKVYNYYKIGFFNGIVTSTLDTTVVLLIMTIFGSTLQLGKLNTIFAIFTITTAYLMNRFYKKQKSKLLITISEVIPVIAVLMLCIVPNTITVVIYKAVNAVFIYILILIAIIERYDCLDKELTKDFSVEHQAMVETVLAGGRVFGLFILLMLSNLIGGLYSIIMMLMIISIVIFVYAYLIKKAIG